MTSTQDLYAVYGASGCGRGVMPLARQQLAQAGVGVDRLVFVDDGADGPARVNGQRVLTYAQFLAEPAAARHAVLAIANSAVREQLAARCAQDGVRAWTVAAANVVRPGITGWAQVNGRNALGWDDKFRLDVWYVDHQSLALDIRILWLTAVKVLRREGISAAGEATMPRFTGALPKNE